MIRSSVLFPALLICLLVTSCIGRTHTLYQPGDMTVAEPSDLSSKRFEYTKTPIPFKNRILHDDERKNYVVRYLRIPSSGNNAQPDNIIAARYYQSKLPGTKGLVIVLPIWGSSIYPSKKITNSIVKKSKGRLNVLWVEGPEQLFDWQTMQQSANESEFAAALTQTTEHLQTNIIDIRRLVDWSEAQPEIDTLRIGLVGFSISAIATSLVLPHDQRINTSVLVMGAAQPSKMIAACYGRLAEVRKIILQRFNWTVDEYQAFVEKIYRNFDPARFARNSNPKNILMIDARNDTCMPQSSRDALWHALGQPERITINYGHKTSFLAMTPIGFNFMSGVIVKFFRERLDHAPQ